MPSAPGGGRAAIATSRPAPRTRKLEPHPCTLEQPALVDVIVCVKDQLEVVRPCIESVVRCSTLPMRLVVVDDASRADTRSYLESLPHPHLSLHRNRHTLGYTRSANLGLALGTSPYRLLLNSDTLVTRGWLERLLRCMESSPATAIVGPVSNRATYQSVPRILAGGGWALNPLPIELDLWGEVVAGIAERSYPRIPNVHGMCWMIRASALATLGPFDEALSPEGYGEENEMARRAEAAGLHCRVADDCFVFHHGGRSFGPRKTHLEALAHRRYVERFGEETVAALERRLRSVPELDRLRGRLEGLLAGEGQPAVLFLLPSLAWYGGIILVLDVVRCLRRLGLDVAAAVPESERPRAHQRDLAGLRFYRSAGDLQEIASVYEAIVSTHHDTIRLQEGLLERHPHLVPFYFVQDYEPGFYPSGSAAHADAVRSYRRGRNSLFAVSRWVVDRLAREHGVEVVKVAGGIDLELFDPCRSRPLEERKLKIAAMIRPQTPWRAPRRTLEVFERIDRRFPGCLRFVSFGCTAEELAALAPEVALEHHGVAAPEWIFALLRNVDVFLDLSDHQAFGRTALEAMAAGCVVLVPEEGGCGDFVRHGENALCCDTADGSAIVDLVAAVVEDEGLRTRLRRAALATALDHGIARGALEQLALFRRRIAEVREERATGTALRDVDLDPQAEEEARAALGLHLAGSGAEHVALQVAQLMDVEAAVGRFLYLRAAAPVDALRAGMPALVVGFGAGSELIAARRIGLGELSGVEVDSALVRIAETRLRGLAATHVGCYEGDRLPFDAETFAVVASGHVIEHTRDPRLHLAECLRVLRPGGLLSLEFPTRFHHTELHSRLPSLEWLPRPLRASALGLLAGRWSPLGPEVRRRYAALAGGLQQISLGGVRRMLRDAHCDWRLVDHARAAPGIVRCVIEKRG